MREDATRGMSGRGAVEGMAATLFAAARGGLARDARAEGAGASEAPVAALRSTGPDDPSGFVLLADVAPDVIQEIRYHTTYNFVGARVDGYERPAALMTREAAEALRAASDDAVSRGWRLKVFDAYRPQAAVDHFVRWASDLEDVAMKPYFYPDLDKSALFDQGYVAERSGHTRGSTVDLTLFDMAAGREADAGGPFDFFGELSRPDFRDGLTEGQLAVRQTLRDVMAGAGFLPIDTEWWHFTLADEPYPDTYFTFPVSAASVA